MKKTPHIVILLYLILGCKLLFSYTLSVREHIQREINQGANAGKALECQVCYPSLHQDSCDGCNSPDLVFQHLKNKLS
jgi:hypothetical protein